MLANSAQSNGDANFLACIAECILACLASIVEYFNKWAFIYVGYALLSDFFSLLEAIADDDRN
jgi:hypothetical protein